MSRTPRLISKPAPESEPETTSPNGVRPCNRQASSKGLDATGPQEPIYWKRSALRTILETLNNICAENKRFWAVNSAAFAAIKMKVFFELTGDYGGLRVRRVARFGRVYLEKVINDGDPYWLVSVRPFDETTDRPILCRLSDQRWGNGTRRFLAEQDAEGYFQKLTAESEYRAEEEKRQILSKRRAEVAKNKLCAFQKAKITQ